MKRVRTGCNEQIRFEPLEDRRMFAGGALDPSFGTGGIAKPNLGFAPIDMAVQSDGRAVVLGRLNKEWIVARLDANGALDRSFGGGDGLATIKFDNDPPPLAIAMAPKDSTDPDVQSVRAQLALGSAPARDDGATAGLRDRVAANPTDWQARHDLAQALAAQGDFAGAVDELLEIVRADREWNDQAARKTLLTVFEAAGAGSDVARDGRRRLSSILFA